MSHARDSRFSPAALAFGALLASLLAVAVAPVAALDPGTAKGRVAYEGTAYPLAHSIAVERQNEFTKKKEIALILSDRPIAFEDVADDWMEHDAAHLTVTLDPAGKATYAQLDRGSSMVGAPDGVRFDGSVDRGSHRVVGKVTSSGVVDVMGSPLEYEVEANAPLFTLAPAAAPTAKDRTAAEGSPQAAAFAALVRAVAARDPEAIAGAISAAYLERAGGESVAQYSVGSDLPSGTARPVRVVATGDRASLYLETEDEKGIVRLVEEQGGWRVDRQKWSSK